MESSLHAERFRLGRMVNPVRGIIDATGAVLALIGAAVLTLGGAMALSNRMALLIYASTMVSLYTVSCLYHSVPWQVEWKQRMQRLDHTMIYLLIAGSYTPLAVIVLDGWLRVATLVVVWGIAVAGGIQKFLLPHLPHGLAVTLTTTQGWLALLLLIPLSQVLPAPAIALTAFGGVLYTVGMVFLVTNRPRLWPRVFSYHEAMHVLVLAGSACHFTMMLRYVAPMA